jgi:integrase
MAIGLATTNPAQGLKIGLKRPLPKHFAAITEPGDSLNAARLRRVCRNARGARRAEAAADALASPRELRGAEWSEIDLDNALWTVPAARMKRQLLGKLNGAPHLVPLARSRLSPCCASFSH